VTVSAPSATLWKALTDAEVVSRWFGDLSTTLLPGTEARLDFGDGDYFAIVDVAASPPGCLGYKWRFLGTGPLSEITWRIEDRREGSRLTVIDSEPMRSRDTVAQLSEGWTDFLRRLQRYVATGKVTRYDWRRDFDGATELTISPIIAEERLFSAAGLLSWLPFAVDAEADRPVPGCAIAAADRRAHRQITLYLRESGWLRPTRCVLTIEPRGIGSILTVCHTGWDEISSDPSRCLRERRSFAQRWIKALEKARLLAA
jgi:uncharacterized protein YndB with AHSA1/START domain